MRRLNFAFACAVALGLLTACSASPGEPPPSPSAVATTPTTTPAVERTPTAPATSGRPNVPARVDAIIDATVAGDVTRLEQLTKPIRLPCGPQQGPGSPPACRPDQPSGTPVEVLPVVTCEGELRPREHIRPTLEQLTTARPRLFGVYRPPMGYLPHAPGEYMAVFSRQDPVSGELGAGLLVNGEGVVAVVFGCLAKPDQIAPPGSQPVLLPGG